MHADDLTKDRGAFVPFELYDLGEAAFERSRCVGNPRASDLVTLGFINASEFELIDICRMAARGRIHRVAHRVFNDVHTEDTCFADIGEAVLAVAINLCAAGGEHDLGRRVGDGVKERIGGQIVDAIRATARNPANRTGRDNRVERIMRQAVAIGRTIEHSKRTLIWFAAEVASC